MFQDFKPEIKLLLLVALIAVVVSVGGIVLLRTLQPAFVEQRVFADKKACEEKMQCKECTVALCDYKCPKDVQKGWVCSSSLYTSLTIKVLDDEDIFNILNSFADQEEYLKIEGMGERELLKDAVQKGNHDIKNRAKEARDKLEVRFSEGVEDAPEMRAVSLVHTKLCVAESIINNDLQRTTEICGRPQDLLYPDDITASMQVLPYFVSGMAYYADGDKEKANDYFEQITSHKKSIAEQYGEGSLDTAGEVYKMILDKVEKLSINDLSIDREDETRQGYLTIETLGEFNVEESKFSLRFGLWSKA